MNARQARSLRTDEVLLKRLAKWVALRAFRNSELEELHAGTFPSSVEGNYGDVKVVSPYGEIPWRDLGRVGDAEMKVLMIDVVNRTYGVLLDLFASSDQGLEKLLAGLREHDPVPRWNEPEAQSAAHH